MTRRWKWDFEEEQATAPTPSRPRLGMSGRPVLAPPAGRGRLASHHRRRRSAAVLAAVILVIALIVVLAGSGGHATGRRSLAGVAPRAGAASPAPKHDIEAEGNAAVAKVLAYTPFVRAGGGASKDIALTFDDGPGPYTPEVLNVLERFHAHATFFSIGKMERYFSVSSTREIRSGDVIGDHTESHPHLALLSAREQHEELFEPLLRFEFLGADRATLFRPPYGSFNATTLAEARRLHLLMVLWSADTEDYLQPGVPVIVQRALEGARPGAILLMHDGGGTRSQTVAALPTIITGLRKLGYTLVTVPELLMHDPPPAGQPLPPNLAGD